MKNGIVAILLLGFLAWYFLYRRPTKTRKEMIDHLNVINYMDGLWAKMSDEEVKTAYTIQRAYEEGVSDLSKIDPELPAKMDALRKKYNIFT